MKRKIILSLSFLIVFLAILWSCHNEDFTKSETNPQRNNANFFKHSQKGGMNARAAVDYINILEAYNRENDFLSKMPDQRGMPIWDKMYEVVTENAVGLMIPLSYDGKTMSSILFATLDGKDKVTGVKDYDNTLLESIVYDQNISVENRERLFLTFMHMDNRTFGNERFIGIPNDLFVGKKSNDEYGIMWIRDIKPSPKVTTQQEGKLMIIESCFIALHCTHHGDPKSICDAEDGCTDCGTIFCTYEIIGTADNPFPSSPGGGGGGGCFSCGSGGNGGGGGGGAPSPNVPSNPCGSSFNNVFYRLAPGCGGGGVPDLPSLDNPCEKTKAILNNPDVQNKLDSLKNKSLSKGEIGFKTKKDGTVTGTISGGKHEVNLGVKVGYQGGYHNHTPTGIPMHSPPDIDNNLLAFARAQPTGEHKNAYFGMIVKKVCSSCTSGFKIYHYIIRFDGTYSDALTSFSQLDLDNFNIDYQNREFDMTNPTGTYGTNYIDSIGKITVEGLEKLFFDTLKAMNLTNKILLQRIEEDGTINNITINSAGTHTTATPCP